ncbi:serine hydrolase domain-containing protein [Balneola sp. EhC07]|uniref:serine hydrolase domain-containing protein n=1 Tax=Balneola sp. EhC07 TaxID=1849360 RepID=UPI0009EE925E|nr:serine hydrolase domain-containing protein [Balneola sp. EhC07]
MKKIVLLPFLLLISYSSVNAYQAEELKLSLQELIDNAIEQDSTIPGILLHVEAPDLNLSYSVSSGVSDLSTRAPLPENGTARIASNTKTYVAVSVLRLWEQGMLELDDPISKHISGKHAQILKSDGYDLNKITIRHLLTHTAGLFDHAGSNTYIEKVFADPSHEWTRTEQVQGCVDWGNPLFEPGEQFSYSDTGYILLGEIIENVTEKSLGKAVRELIGFKKIGLNATWWEKIEQKLTASPERIHQYFQGMDTFNFDPSLDLYGGGGLVANTKDMARFYQELFAGNVFEQSSTLDTMITKVSFPEEYTPSSDYRMGIFYFKFNEMDMYSHSGFWSTQATYIPELNASVSIIITQFAKGRLINRLLNETAGLLEGY